MVVPSYPPPVTRPGRPRAFLAAYWHWLVVGAIIAVRTATLGLSSYGEYQGYGEVLYTRLARNPEITPDLALLPMRYFPIRISTLLMGESEWTARFPGMIALALCAVLASGIGRHLAGDFGQRWAPVFLVGNPWVLVWFGRALPDAWLVTGLLATGYFALRANTHPWRFAPLVAGGITLALAAKPTGILAFPMLMFLRRRDAFLLTVSSLAILAVGLSWFVGHGDVWKAPIRLFSVISSRHTVEARFADLPGMIVHGWAFGCAATAWFGWAPTQGFTSWLRAPLSWPQDATIPLFAFAGYAAWDALPGHAYYFLPAAAWSSILAVQWFARRPHLLRFALTATAVAAPLVLFDTGDLGDNRNRIVESLPPGVDVSVPIGLQPMMSYYRPDLVFHPTDAPANFTVIAHELDNCRLIATRSYAWHELHAYDCRTTFM